MNRDKDKDIKERLFRHDCFVPPPEDVIVQYIYSGYFVYFRRAVKRLLIADLNNPLARNAFKSNYAIRMEQNRHLRYYYCMIHPFSIARAYWEAFFMVVLCLILVLTPLLSVSLDGIQQYSKYFVKSVRYLNFFGIADIFLTFFTGVYVHQTRKVVLDPKIVAKKYLLGFFFVDLLASFPFGMTKEAIFKKTSYTYYVLSFTPFIRVLRVANLMKYIDRFRDWRHHSYYKIKIIKLFIIFVILVMWSSSVMYRVAFHGKSKWLWEGQIIRNLALSILKAVYELVHVGSDINNSRSVGDIIVSIVCIIVGFVFNLFVVGQIMYLLQKYNKSRNKYSHLLQEIRQYCRYKQLPDSTKKRLYQYYNFRYQKSFFNEEEILNTLSPQLRQEIMLHTCKHLLEKVVYLKNLPISTYVGIGSTIETEFYLPNDIIYEVGAEGDKIFFIVTGKVAIYNQEKQEICHLSDEDYFGEFAILSDDVKRLITVVAIEPIEVLTLSRSNFQKAIKRYPELLARITEVALKDARHVLDSNTVENYYIQRAKDKKHV